MGRAANFLASVREVDIWNVGTTTEIYNMHYKMYLYKAWKQGRKLGNRKVTRFPQAATGRGGESSGGAAAWRGRLHRQAVKACGTAYLPAMPAALSSLLHIAHC